jgi:hypothetical protein
MEAFSRYLMENGLSSEMFLHTSPDSSILTRVYHDGKIPVTIEDFVRNFGKGRVCIVDARDLNLRLLEGCRVIAVDNRCEERANLEGSGVLFFDTLPHPDADTGEILHNFLASAELTGYANRCEMESGQERRAALHFTGRYFEKSIRSPASGVRSSIARLLDADEHTPGGLLIYRGGFERDPELEKLLCRACERGDYSFAVSIGNSGSSGNGGNMSDTGCPIHLFGLHPVAFYRLLFASDIVFTHFGVTMMEALLLKRPVVLTRTIPFSDDHRILSEYMKFATGLPMVEASIPADIPEEWEKPPLIAPEGGGYRRLLELIRILSGM